MAEKQDWGRGHAADHALLVVLGDLEVENVATFSAMFIAGNVQVHGPLDVDVLVGSKLTATEKAARGEKATRLGLAQKKLKAIPEEVSSLTGLESLTLDTNDLAESSPRIGELRALKSLSLESLPLTTLPVELCRLPALKKLSLRYFGFWRFFKTTPGRVQVLVDGLGRMPKLTHAGFFQGSCPRCRGDSRRSTDSSSSSWGWIASPRRR